MAKLIRILIILCVLLISCNSKDSTPKKVKSQDNTQIEKALKRALLRGFYTQISDSESMAIYQDNIYYLSVASKGFGENIFFLHLIKEDGSFENLNFKKEKLILDESLTGIFSTIEIVHKKLNFEAYESIRTGQFIRNKDNSTSNVWVKQFKVNNLLQGNNNYNNQLNKHINSNLNQEDFEKSLKLGSFFKAKSDFFVLLIDNDFFLIKKGSGEVKEKIMFHLIKKDNTFDNISFNFKSKSYDQLLDKPFNNSQIAKINIPFEEDYVRIRIGQYNEKGNIWAQELKLDEILSNDLLRYNDELK